MDDQRTLRAALSSPRNQRPLGAYVLRGGLSGLAVMGSILVYDAFSEPGFAATGARVASAAVKAEPKPEVAPEPTFAQAEAAAAPTIAQADSASGRVPDIQTIQVEETADPAPAPALAEEIGDGTKEAVVALVSPADEIVDPPRIETARDERSVAPAAFALAELPEPTTPRAAASPDVAELTQVASLVAVEPSKAPVQPDQVAMDVQFDAMNVALLAGPDGAPTAPAAPAAAPQSMETPAHPIIDGERALVQAEISLSSTWAFDPELERGAGYAALVAPQLDAPSTPALTADTAAVGAPLEVLSTAPYARTPDLKAPAVVAVLGAEPPAGFISDKAPGEPAMDYLNDAGRVSAFRSATPDGAEGWRRFAVAAPANPQNLPVLAIVIDEVGAYGAPVEDVAALSPMVTTSVIPSTPDAATIADQLRASGREVLAHMPMETYASFDEGPRPILKRMTDDEVRETARWHLSQISGVVGVNNHLGGKATRDHRVMDVLMAELSQRGLMFLDSRTSMKSVAEQAARDAGMLATRNHRFIDNEISDQAIMRELNAAAAMARRYGAAVALGNPHPATVRAVRRWMESHDGKSVLVAPITHVAGVLNAASEAAVASK